MEKSFLYVLTHHSSWWHDHASLPHGLNQIGFRINITFWNWLQSQDHHSIILIFQSPFFKGAASLKVLPSHINSHEININSTSGWWFQPLWKIVVHRDDDKTHQVQLKSAFLKAKQLRFAGPARHRPRPCLAGCGMQGCLDVAYGLLAKVLGKDREVIWMGFYHIDPIVIP